MLKQLYVFAFCVCVCVVIMKWCCASASPLQWFKMPPKCSYIFMAGLVVLQTPTGFHIDFSTFDFFFWLVVGVYVFGCVLCAFVKASPKQKQQLPVQHCLITSMIDTVRGLSCSVFALENVLKPFFIIII